MADDTYPVTTLSSVLSRCKDETFIQELETYARLTIRMNGQGVILRDRVFGSQIGTKKQFIAKAGQFVLSKIDARNGAFGIIPDECDQAIITGNFWAFDVDHTRLEARFFEYLTKTRIFIDFCIRASEGTTNRLYLQEVDFLTQKITLPSLEEQRRVVARIEELVAKVDEARGLRSKTTQQIGAFASSLHLDLAGSRVIKLGDALMLDEQQEKVRLGQQYPQVGVRGFGGGLFARETLDATQTTYRAFNRLYEGAILLSQVKGWEGAIAGCPKSLVGKYVSPEYRTFRCIPDQALPEYMAALVITPWFWNQLKSLARGLGGRRERTRPELFLQMEIPMPTVKQQKYALSTFSQLNTLKQLQFETEAELNALLPSILNRAFKGEL